MLIRIQLLILMLSRIRLLTLMRIRILLLIKLMRSAISGLQILPGSILSLHASIFSIQCPPRLHSEPLKLLNSDFNMDVTQLFTLIRIRMQRPKIMRIRIRNPAIFVRSNTGISRYGILCFLLVG
jgi:hypothetical protein